MSRILCTGGGGGGVGVCIPACTGADTHPPPTATAADGTHPFLVLRNVIKTLGSFTTNERKRMKMSPTNVISATDVDLHGKPVKYKENF